MRNATSAVLAVLGFVGLAKAGPLQDNKLWDKANETMQAAQKKVMENIQHHPSCGIKIGYSFDEASYKGLVYRPEARNNPGLAKDPSPIYTKLWYAPGCAGIYDGMDNFCMNQSGKNRQALVDSKIDAVVCHFDDSVGLSPKGDYTGTPPEVYPIPKIVRKKNVLHYYYNGHSVNVLETTRDWLSANL